MTTIAHVATEAQVEDTLAQRSVVVLREAAPWARPGPRCAFCHGAFERADAPFACPRCDALLHDGCWREVGRCTSLGCRGPAVRLRARTVAASPACSATRRIVAAGLHALALGLWSGLALVMLAGVLVTSTLPHRLPDPTVPILVCMAGWWWLLAGAGRRPRIGSWLGANAPLVGSGLAASVGLLFACAMN